MAALSVAIFAARVYQQRTECPLPGLGISPTLSDMKNAVAVLLALPGTLFAHHSQQPFFHMDRNIEISGKVLAFDFVNPHPIIFLEVVDESGNVSQWQIEGPTAIYLARTGWNAHSLEPGDVITVRGAPARKADAKAMAGRVVTAQDGTRLNLYAEDATRVLDLRQ
jgi:hypothetical protein